MNLAQRSFKVIDFGTNRKRVYIHIPISGQQQLGPYLTPFQIYGGLNVENRQFSLYPSSISAKIWGVPFGVDPSCWGMQRVKRLG